MLKLKVVSLKSCSGGGCLLLQLKLMTSWAVVCDVYFLPPQMRADGETAQQFAERCQVPHPPQHPCRCCGGCSAHPHGA
jgi:hypothetical protein